MILHYGISNCGVFMEFLYSITTYKCGVYNIPEKLQMITTFFTYYGTNLVFPVINICVSHCRIITNVYSKLVISGHAHLYLLGFP